MAYIPRELATLLPFSTEQHYLSEGPYILQNPNSWGSGTIFSFVNIQSGQDRPGQLHIVDTTSGGWKHTVHELPKPVGFAFPATEEGQFVIGCGKGVAVFDTRTKKVVSLIDSLDTVETMVNDALLVEDGLIFGTKFVKSPEKLAGLWYYPYEHRKPVLLLPNLKISNGMDFIRDHAGHTWLIHTDTPDRVIKKYPFDSKTGKLDTDRAQIVVDLTHLKSGPDGLTLSPDKKHLIVALWNDDEDATEGEAHQYSVETGRLERVFVVPGSPRVTCPILVKDKVILTTAWEGSEKLRKSQPNSGRIFVANTTGDGFDFGNIPNAPKFVTAKL